MRSATLHARLFSPGFSVRGIDNLRPSSHPATLRFTHWAKAAHYTSRGHWSQDIMLIPLLPETKQRVYSLRTPPTTRITAGISSPREPAWSGTAYHPGLDRWKFLPNGLIKRARVGGSKKPDDLQTLPANTANINIIDAYGVTLSLKIS